MLGSIPATTTLVLFPGTTATGAVLCQSGVGPAGVNSTVIEVPDDGGALNRATSGLDIGLITGTPPVARDCAV